MSVNLTDLVAYLQTDVPARDSVPTEAQYERAVKQAVRDLGRKAPLKKRTSLSITDGTADYSLPDDFVRLIRIETSIAVSGVRHTSEGLVPLNIQSPASYEHAINGTTITFYPTPAFNDTWYVWYAAGYALNASDVYTDLDDERAEIALLRAQALALTMQANAVTHHAWKYSAGDEDVDKTKLRAEIEAQAQALNMEFETRVKSLVGPVGFRGR